MNMDVNKISKAFLVIALIGAAAVFFFFYQMGQKDAKKLADFLIAYDKFDMAITDFSIPVLASSSEAPPAADDLERNADEAFAAEYQSIHKNIFFNETRWRNYEHNA
jgi:hypothetical protein